MTNLQVQYQQLQETKRSNLAREGLTHQEVSVKEREADLKTIETKLKEMKAPAEITKLISESNLNTKQLDQVDQQIDKMKHEIGLIDANKHLSYAQANTEYTKIANNAINLISRLTSWQPMGDRRELLEEWIGNFIGGLGKGVSRLIG